MGTLIHRALAVLQQRSSGNTNKAVLLYIERWLMAPEIHPEGTEEAQDVGPPQGGVISPLLANLFLHYAFDKWMALNYTQIPFERYVGDMVCHCTSEEQARDLWQVLRDHFTACHLTLHPDKTRIVYGKQTGRNGAYPNVTFDFLGYTFRPRMTMSREGRIFLGLVLPRILWLEVEFSEEE